ncbi:hypothetical protein R8Z57_06435 [Microbacterium sp. M3]|uniref:SRPBCC family protein n=1 Tax=Microbacterium arthrosphaerae TaxID=792652 RepID=A0ABU4GZB3_9MICO|nr:MULTISPECIES: hypothetical protein [Microbacterium]MDW4572418.1 hypothetical protein [Microbacterium arthrosphaerae]MDW7606273.1 hypothetical protein [Microbacterium sp. M3]
MAAAYSFVSHWQAPASPERVWAELERSLVPVTTGPRARPGWWPGVEVPMPPRRLVPGERVVLAVRSPLGYVLRMRLELTDVEPGRTLAARSDGDLRGSGRLEVAPALRDATCAEVRVRWDVETRRAWMNATAWVLRPAFTRAHGTVMRRGERGLRRALSGA